MLSFRFFLGVVAGAAVMLAVGLHCGVDYGPLYKKAESLARTGWERVRYRGQETDTSGAAGAEDTKTAEPSSWY